MHSIKHQVSFLEHAFPMCSFFFITKHSIGGVHHICHFQVLSIMNKTADSIPCTNICVDTYFHSSWGNTKEENSSDIW